MLIEEFNLEVFTPPCLPGAETWTAVAHVQTDLGPVLPYLNASLQGAVFNQAARALIWKEKEVGIAVHHDRVVIGNLEDRVQAQEVLDELIDRINRSWERRKEISPSYETRPRPTPMAVFQLLPGTNCRECGHPTCFTFALKLVAEQQTALDCPVLQRPEHSSQLTRLRELLGESPVECP